MSQRRQHTTASLPDQAQLANLVDTILTAAAAHGASASEAAVSASQGLAVTVRLGDVEKLEHHRSRSLAVTVYFGQRKGSASTADWSPAAVTETVQAACAIARHTAADPCAGLAEPERLARVIPELALYHPWALEGPAAIALARDCEAAALGLDARIKNSEGGSLASTAGLSYYGNSHGFRGGYPTTRHSLSCSVIAQDHGGMQRGAWYSAARDQQDLQTPLAVGHEAARRAVERLGARRLATCTAPVLFIPEQARGLFGHWIGAISGGALYRNASFLLDHAGQRIFPEYVTIQENPHLPKALASAPFDGEGVATAPRELVRAGVLQGYVLDSYSARRLGLTTTGNSGGIHNVLVAPGSLDFAALVKTLGKGLIVTQLMGQGVNLVTGDYSRGASGFWVEQGEIQYPVEEITIAGNLRTLFANLVHVGNDIDIRGAIRCGSVLVESMTIAGK